MKESDWEIEFQGIDGTGKAEVEYRKATLIVCGQRNTHLIPAIEQDIRMVVGFFSQECNAIHQAKGGCKVACWHFAHDGCAITAPPWHIDQSIGQLGFGKQRRAGHDS
jgi:hypothetical protein